ncbi:hypothetical protein FJ364_02625 [Candidatus Dependentiae bacterium]|nr:hypothetical protein [Candidatus Dependentiae bacterium]
MALLFTQCDAPRTASPLFATQLEVASNARDFAFTQFDVVLSVDHCALIKFELTRTNPVRPLIEAIAFEVVLTNIALLFTQ